LDGRLDRARLYLERAAAMFDRENKKYKSYGDWNYVETLKSLGLVAEAQGRSDEALAYLGRARDVYLHISAPASRDPSKAYARLLRKVGRIAEAEKIEANLKVDGAK
jgi:tetratricopeptide (TPR) repeat protein